MKAFELARINVANRPTLLAFELAYATAVAGGESDIASEFLATAGKQPQFAPLRSKPVHLDFS